MPNDFRKFNGVLRWFAPVGDGTFGITAVACDGRWNSTDQIRRERSTAG